MCSNTYTRTSEGSGCRGHAQGALCLPFVQERWESEQLKRTKLAAGKAAAGGQVGGQQYDLLLEDHIDFIRDAVIKGDIDPVSRCYCWWCLMLSWCYCWWCLMLSWCYCWWCLMLSWCYCWWCLMLSWCYCWWCLVLSCGWCKQQAACGVASCGGVGGVGPLMHCYAAAALP